MNLKRGGVASIVMAVGYLGLPILSALVAYFAFGFAWYWLPFVGSGAALLMAIAIVVLKIGDN